MIIEFLEILICEFYDILARLDDPSLGFRIFPFGPDLCDNVNICSKTFNFIVREFLLVSALWLASPVSVV